MLLDDKNAVIYEGGGPIGGAVARAFAREAARVFLAGRTRSKLEDVAEQIRSAGGVGGIPESLPETVPGRDAIIEKSIVPRRCLDAPRRSRTSVMRQRSQPLTAPAA